MLKLNQKAKLSNITKLTSELELPFLWLECMKLITKLTSELELPILKIIYYVSVGYFIYTNNLF